MEKRESKFGEVVDRIGGLGIVVNKDNEEGLAWYGLYGLVNEEDELIIPCEYLNLQMVDYGLIRVENQSGIYAYLDHRGKEVVPFSRGYKFAGSFINGLAIVGKYTEQLDDFIDAIFEDDDFDQYDLLDDPVNGTERSPLFCIKECPKYFGFIDQFGNELIPLQYQDAKCFYKGLAAVKDSNGKWGCIDTAGEVVIPFEYDDMMNTFHPGFEGFIEGAIVVKKDGKWRTITKENIPVIPLEYDEVLSRYIHVAVVMKDMRRLWNSLKYSIN
ncbi:MULTISPECIES: WG repeat-containing protein [Paenibacillus]|uniref:WG repeat-containing protein n=1 Tax=Paenibacillus aceti TaxID=1820010 RepID=A0ABQ1VRA5_9BACL|nr:MULTISPECIES: WG repeat-containing protein [Paenibacillus]GGF88813.1 hypothetical protein GCM10010913_07860 [Paenibacillus aceti]